MYPTRYFPARQFATRYFPRYHVLDVSLTADLLELALSLQAPTVSSTASGEALVNVGLVTLVSQPLAPSLFGSAVADAILQTATVAQLDPSAIAGALADASLLAASLGLQNPVITVTASPTVPVGLFTLSFSLSRASVTSNVSAARHSSIAISIGIGIGS